MNNKDFIECTCKNAIKSKYKVLEISEDQIINTRLVFSRESALSHERIKNARRIVEIGTMAGDFAQTILDCINPKQLTIIDTFNVDDTMTKKFIAKDHFKFVSDRFINDQRVTVIRGKGSDILPEIHVSGKKYDFIYIDSSHSFVDTFNELVWSSMVLSDDGVIGIDDFSQQLYDPSTPFEVVEAVTQFLNMNKEFKVLLFSFNKSGFYNIYLSKTW